MESKIGKDYIALTADVKDYIEELESRIIKVEEALAVTVGKVNELEKRPTARYCELCSQTTFQKFVRFKWEKKGKEFEICPKCARLEYKNKERAKQEKDWKGFGSVKMR